MSAMSTAVWQQTCHICDKVHKVVHNTIVQMQRARQLSANREIINQLPALRAVTRDKDLMFYVDEMNEQTNKLYDSKLIK